MTPLTDADRRAFAAKLAERAQVLRGEIAAVRDAQADRSGAGEHDVLDRKDEALQHGLDTVDDAQIERDRNELLRVLAALQRIEQGRFGVCVDCEQPIDGRRLAAMPEAERCAACQAQHDHEGGDGFLVLDAMHRQTLIHLDDLATLVESLRDKGVTASARVRASRLLRFFNTQARRHHEDEERHVFPPLLASGDAALVQNVLRLQQDHFWLEENWREIEPQLAAVADGVGTCEAAVLSDAVQVLVALHRDHIELEESMVYPKARMRLGAYGRREMGREMAARRRSAAAGQRKA